MPSRKAGGLVLRYFPPNRDASGALGFLPTEVARRVTVLSSITSVPGAPPEVAGLALADGAVVTVLWVCPPREVGALRRNETAVLCAVPEAAPPAAPAAPDASLALALEAGIDVALAGGIVVATGLFEQAAEALEGAVMLDGDVIPMLDVRDLVARCSPVSGRARLFSDSSRDMSTR